MGFRRSWRSLVVMASLVASIAPLATTTMGAQASPNKTVVEEVTGWLRIFSDGTVERLTPPGAEPFTAIVPPYTEPRGGVTVHDITTDHGVDVRLYLPEPAAAPSRRRPVVVHFHGGGFCVSRPSWALYHNFYAPLTTELKVAGIVSVYLPLAPEHRLPAAVDTGHDALLWLRDVACGHNAVVADGSSTAAWNASGRRPTSPACSSSVTAPVATSCTLWLHVQVRMAWVLSTQ
ncbi:hypothetical protein BS78_05G129000 [Paspalum vaginatum]|nr:hypothetical protein BS78_05G129000 [Paspalum vaginatum]